MTDRLKQVRKAAKLNQEEFGARIGVTNSAVSYWEKGVRNIPDTAILSICREFNVSETWLRTGEGEMFAPLSREAELGRLIGRLAKDRDETFRTTLLTALLRIPPESPLWTDLEQLFRDVGEAARKKEDPEI